MDCKILLLILTVISASTADVDDLTLVTLPDGQIRGKQLLTSKDTVYYAFQEIPYATPPVGELRYQAPIPPEPWEGILNATANTKICYQNGGFAASSDLVESEDCLYLNVYTPLKPGETSETPLPVLLWIHGGAFETGAGAFQMFSPNLFIDYNVIVVTINYRLGVLGFLTTEDGIIPGNIGLKDQHLAIKWTKVNINLFGGDPEKITISGESAGALSVGFQIVSLRNEGLFRAGILQSGTALCDTGYQSSARFNAFELGRTLDPTFDSDDSQDLLKLLQNLPATVIAGYASLATAKQSGLIDGLIWVPVIEDASLEGAFLTGPFQEDIRNGNINKVPILIGFNSEEQLFFVKMDPTKLERIPKYLDSDVTNLIGNKFNMTPANKLTASTRLKEIYTDKTFEEDLGATVKFFTDETFAVSVIRHAKLQSNYTDVFLYQFSYKGEMGGLMDFEVGGVGGVGHTEDLVYLWDTRMPGDTSSNNPEDLVTRQRLLTMWTNFVKYLNPTPEEDNLLDNVTWEKVSPNNLVYLNINSTLEMRTNPREYLRWERIVDIYAIPPLINY